MTFVVQEYADTYNLRELIQLDTVVTSVERSAGGNLYLKVYPRGLQIAPE